MAGEKKVVPGKGLELPLPYGKLILSSFTREAFIFLLD